LDRPETGPGARDIEGKSVELFEMERRQSLESSRPVFGQLQSYDPVVVVAAGAQDQPGGLGAVDEADCTVVAEQQVVGDLADSRAPRIRMPADGEQELVLGGCEPGGLSLLGAPRLEVAETRP
jgi:hypothetical protein